MAATLSSTGTWTPLATNLAAIEDVKKNHNQQLRVEASDLRVPPDEIRQMILMAQSGWGASLGAGRRLDFHTAAKLLLTFFQAFLTPGAPRPGSTVTTEV